MSFADNFCKLIQPRSGSTKFWPDLDPNCLTLMVFLKEFFEKVDFEKNQQATESLEKNPRGQRVKV